MKILVLNAGSSSQKSCLYELNDAPSPEAPHPLWEGQIDWTHQHNQAEMKIKTYRGQVLKQELTMTSRLEITLMMLETLWSGDTQVIQDKSEIDVVGHRVVHGGQEYQASTIVTSGVKETISQLSALAPAHNPANLEGMVAIEQILGDRIPQVAVFDTAFHSQMPLAAAIYPVPYEWYEQGIRRYGFHGISHQYCAERTAQILNRDLKTLKLITCHLGNGCSLAAIQNGYSVDTTMGFTPLEGLMMGTRSGSIDPGILIHLQQQKGYSVDQLNQILNKSSGFLGISGISGDMRQIEAALAAGNERAELAVEVYIHRLKAAIGAMLASLNGLDALIFTAGVGENAAEIRARTCEGLAFLGVKLDLEKNAQRPIDQDIATPDSSIRVLVIHTQEDWAIARQCWYLQQEQQAK